QEFRRKVRIVAGAFRELLRVQGVPGPFRPQQLRAKRTGHTLSAEQLAERPGHDAYLAAKLLPDIHGGVFGGNSRRVIENPLTSQGHVHADDEVVEDCIAWQGSE